ncbi:hypothetical protein [Kitasatospora herbaricolor]|uniref:Uncharacterized protein n=1 Tax=Kitasatospora herbaricolor TaxID=68217 RepID=A0ABZ1WI82_9ACTN|nr:hypothetical protein [Kitasatospora herbaricolor]
MPTPLFYAYVLWSFCLLVVGLSVLKEFLARVPAGLEPGDVVLLFLATGVLVALGVLVRRATRGHRRARAALDVLTALALLPTTATIVWALNGSVPLSGTDLVATGGIALPLTAQVLMHLPSVRSAYHRWEGGGPHPGG